MKEMIQGDETKDAEIRETGYLVLAIFVLILGIAAVVISGKETIGYLKGPVDLNTISAGDLKDAVYGEVELSKAYLYGCYDISYRTEEGIKIPESYFYVLYIGDYASGNARFIGIEVNEERITQMDKIVDESWEAIESGQPLEEFSELTIKGKFKKMSDDGYTNFANALTKMGLESSVIQKNSLRLVLEENGTTDKNMFILFGTGGILILAGFIWMVCLIVIKFRRMEP